MQLRGASFILRMKSRVLLRSEVGMIMASICLHDVISWSQASGRGRFGPTKPVIAEKYHPSVLKFCLTWTVYNISNKMTKFYDDVYSFEPVRGCQFLKLYISMFEKWLESTQWLLAGEQTQSAHACDVSLGARIVLTLHPRVGLEVTWGNGYFWQPAMATTWTGGFEHAHCTTSDEFVRPCPRKSLHVATSWDKDIRGKSLGHGLGSV